VEVTNSNLHFPLLYGHIKKKEKKETHVDMVGIQKRRGKKERKEVAMVGWALMMMIMRPFFFTQFYN
jgi:hypothetical protein